MSLRESDEMEETVWSKQSERKRFVCACVGNERRVTANSLLWSFAPFVYNLSHVRQDWSETSA